MDFRNPAAAQNSSHSVNIICKAGTAEYSFVSHLFAALRREGISVFLDRGGYKADIGGYKNQAISVIIISNKVEANDPCSHMFIDVIKPRRDDDGIRIMVPSYGYNRFNQVWAKRRQEAGILTRHKTRFVLKNKFAKPDFEEFK